MSTRKVVDFFKATIEQNVLHGISCGAFIAISDGNGMGIQLFYVFSGLTMGEADCSFHMSFLKLLLYPGIDDLNLLPRGFEGFQILTSYERSLSMDGIFLNHPCVEHRVFGGGK